MMAAGYPMDPRQVCDLMQRLNKDYGDMVRIEAPLRNSAVIVFTPELAEKTYRAAGAMPYRPGMYGT